MTMTVWLEKPLRELFEVDRARLVGIETAENVDHPLKVLLQRLAEHLGGDRRVGWLVGWRDLVEHMRQAAAPS